MAEFRAVVCSFVDAVGSSENGRHHWEFHHIFGPTFTRKDGTPLKNQPSVHGAAWAAFGRWMAKRQPPQVSGNDQT